MSIERWRQIGTDAYGELAAEHGTPFYLYDADVLVARVERVRGAFDGLASVVYAVKTNPNLELLRAIREQVDGLDVSSGGELEQAALAGYDPSTVSFAGPAKTLAELRRSVELGVGLISVESPRELEALAEIASELGSRANVSVRVNPELTIRSFGLKMGGKPIQFGIDEEELAGALDFVRRHDEALAFRGLHVYAGSQSFDPADVAAGVRNTLRLVEEAERGTGLRCAAVNFGGGFGVSHGEEEREFDVDALARELLPTLREFRDASGTPRELIFELGRYLAADAGLYVTRVIGTKRSRGKQYVLVDGGLHHHLPAAGMFGVGLRSNYVLDNLSREQAPRIRCHVAGPLCNPSDLLGVDVELAQPEPGDLIGVLKSGSYAFSSSPLLFLGRPTPAELIRRDGEIVLGRRSRTMTEFN